MALTDETTDTAATFADAMAGGDFDRAESALAAMGKSVPEPLLESAADLQMHCRRWREAARLLGRVRDRSVGQQLKQRLARNRAELTEYRPDVAAKLDAVDADHTFQITAAPNGMLTILHRPTDGSAPTILSPGNDPATALRQSLEQLKEACTSGQSIGVYGLGDGYLLAALPEHTPPARLGEQSCVHVIAAEPGHVALAMAIHDYTGEGGPIRDERFKWWIGADWPRQMQAAIEADPMLPFPQMFSVQGRQGRRIADQVAAIGRAISDVALKIQPQLEAYYASLDPAELAAVFGDDPPRRPRALIITSRFTTVLQYSARDSEAALRQLGWDTALLIEPSTHHQLSGIAIQRVLDELRPDLVFVIDHLRGEFPPVFPASLPWVCWVQDHLINLTNTKAGRSITKRDFVLTPFGPLYSARHEYPARQCIALGKLTRAVDRPASWSTDGDDLAFVSHASQQPEQLIATALESVRGHAVAEQLIRRCAQRIIDVYGAGGSLPTPCDVRLEFDAAERDLDLRFPDESTRLNVIDLLFSHLNNTLYRQQALGWFADAADRLGLSLALYGKGWEQHPRFGRYARGAIDYGQPLADLTRRTKINLQIVPFFCLHQRLLDGLVAGGFFLIRAHPYDTMGPALLDFIHTHCINPAKIDSVEAARDAVDSQHRAALDALLDGAVTLGERGDPVGIVQSWRRAGWLIPHQPTLPHLDAVSFDSAAGVESLLQRYLTEPNAADARRKIADAQRSDIESRLTYEASLRHVTRRIGQLIATEKETGNDE